MRQSTGGEPRARLSGAPPHVAVLAACVVAPKRPDPGGSLVPEIEANDFLLILVSGRRHAGRSPPANFVFQRRAHMMWINIIYFCIT